MSTRLFSLSYQLGQSCNLISAAPERRPVSERHTKPYGPTVHWQSQQRNEIGSPPRRLRYPGLIASLGPPPSNREQNVGHVRRLEYTRANRRNLSLSLSVSVPGDPAAGKAGSGCREGCRDSERGMKEWGPRKARSRLWNPKIPGLAAAGELPGAVGQAERLCRAFHDRALVCCRAGTAEREKRKKQKRRNWLRLTRPAPLPFSLAGDFASSELHECAWDRTGIFEQ
ncbi:hypothetical protein MRX96_026862 [Rhipicephalus microplus]